MKSDLPKLKKGDQVIIAWREKSPGFWDSSNAMFDIMRQGRSHIVASAKPDMDRYSLVGFQWTWRREDLVLTLPADKFVYEPNKAFKLKKMRLR